MGWGSDTLWELSTFRIRAAEASLPRVSPGFDPKYPETNLKESVTKERIATSISSTPILKSAKTNGPHAAKPDVRILVRRVVVQVSVNGPAFVPDIVRQSTDKAHFAVRRCPSK